ncbi:MAG: Flp pilus assembly protein CpaB [Planctomycetota bacterium]
MNQRLLLVVAIVLGLLAGGVSLVYLQRQADAVVVVPEREVYAARRDLAASERLNVQRDLMVVKVPATDEFSGLLNAALTPAFAMGLDDRVINRPVAAGTPVFLGDLEPMKDLTIAPGMRAMSVTVSGADGLSGLLVPGDEVKVFVSRPVREEADLRGLQQAMTANPDDAQVAVQLMMAEAMLGQETQRWETQLVSDERFRVLAVGRQLSGTRQQFQMAPAAQSGGYGTVTLEVTEPQARTILEQSGAGSLPITLILCPREGA